MPAKKQSAKGQAGKKAAIKSSGKKRPSPGTPPSYDVQSEAPVIVKGGPQLSNNGVGESWILTSVTPLDFTFDPQVSSMPNAYSPSSGKAITGFVVIRDQTGQVVFSYDATTEGPYTISFE